MKENYFKSYPEAKEFMDFHVLLEENVQDGIKQAAEAYNADIIAMTYKKESFFERLFSGSDTKKMAYHSKVPLLTFHEL